MMARGFRTPRASAHIGTALGIALAGASIGLAAPSQAAPEGPDGVEETAVEQAGQISLVDVGGLGPATLMPSRVLGVPPGLAPLRPSDTLVFLDIG